MLLHRRPHDSVEVVALLDRLDAAAAQPLREALKGIIDRGRSRLVLDLSGVTFMDSSGLSVLVTTLKTARAAGGDVVLLGLTPTVRSLIQLTRLHRVFLIFDDESDAVAALGR